MQVTAEIRHAFLFAAMDLEHGFTETTLTHGADKHCPDVQEGREKYCKGHRQYNPKKIDKLSVAVYVSAAFEAKESEELLQWLTLEEKLAFGRKLLELTGGADPTGGDRTLTTDLTEDR